MDGYEHAVRCLELNVAELKAALDEARRLNTDLKAKSQITGHERSKMQVSKASTCSASEDGVSPAYEVAAIRADLLSAENRASAAEDAAAKFRASLEHRSAVAKGLQEECANLRWRVLELEEESR